MMEKDFETMLRQQARQRAIFKKNLAAYVLVNTFFVGVWYFTRSSESSNFWPVWVMLGWGLGLGLQYVKAYHGPNTMQEEKEYENLKRNNQA